MKYRLLFILLLQMCAYTASYSSNPDFVVAMDGSGDYKKVQDAINAVPDFRKAETIIFVKNGEYKEKLVLPACKNKVTLIGEDAAKTIITFDDYASKKNIFGEEMGTTGSSGFFVFGNEFYAKNLTFENSSGPVGQAVAVRVDGDMVCFENCRFLGFQDTLYPHGDGSKSRQYYKNCYIEGTVDFIFGWSTAVFQDCDIFCKNKGYVTAASTNEGVSYGFVFIHCKIDGDAPEGSVYLGRPWRSFAKTVFIECELGKVINKVGWHNWDKEDAEKNAFYAEYKNTGEGADIKERVKWSKQLTSKQREEYSLSAIFQEWTPPCDNQ